MVFWQGFDEWTGVYQVYWGGRACGKKEQHVQRHSDMRHEQFWMIYVIWCSTEHNVEWEVLEMRWKVLPGRPGEEDIFMNLWVCVRTAYIWDLPFIALYLPWVPLYKTVFVAFPDHAGCLALIGLDGGEDSGDILERTWSQGERLRLNPDCLLY